MTLVLDNEAAQALADHHHRKHDTVMRFYSAAMRRAGRERVAFRVLVPTTVRVEACLDRTSPKSQGLGRLQVADVPLDAARANAAARLRAAAGGSTVDACVAELAASLDGPVTVLTADLTDVPQLLAVAGSTAVVHRV